MKTRILYTQFWKDNFISELSPLEKLVFNYLLTNEHINILHVYECTDRQIRFDTGVDTPTLEKAKQRFESAGKIFFKDGYVYLKNADKYETFTGEKNEKAKEDIIHRLNPVILNWYSNLRDTPIYTPILDTPSKGSRNHKSETINHKSEIRNHKSEIKKTTYNTLKSVNSEALFEELAERYGVSAEYVAERYEDLRIYCGSNGKIYKDYYLALINFIRNNRKSHSYAGGKNERPNIVFVNPK